MKDIQGKEIEVGTRVGYAGTGAIYLGTVIKIADNNTKTRRRQLEYAARYPESRYAESILQDAGLIYTILRDHNQKPIRIDSSKKIIVL